MMPCSLKNQGAELPPGAGPIFCAFSRFTGLGLGVEALLSQKTGTASLLDPWDSYVFCRDILSVFGRFMFSHFGQKSTEGTVTTRINVWTCRYPLLTRWERKGVN